MKGNSAEVTRVRAHGLKFNCFWLEKPGESRAALDACQPGETPAKLQEAATAEVHHMALMHFRRLLNELILD